jgi:hypothetical protein
MMHFFFFFYVYLICLTILFNSNFFNQRKIKIQEVKQEVDLLLPAGGRRRAPWLPWFKIFLLVVLPFLIFGAWFGGIITTDNKGYSPGSLETMFLVFLCLLLLSLAAAGAFLVGRTNKDSISGMVAQVWNPISYLTILVSFFTSAFVICGGIATVRWSRNPDSNEFWLTIMGGFSPILIWLIFLFPLAVDGLTSDDLGMTPADGPNGRPFAKHVPVAGQPTYTLYFYPCWSKLGHISSPCPWPHSAWNFCWLVPFELG